MAGNDDNYALGGIQNQKFPHQLAFFDDKQISFVACAVTFNVAYSEGKKKKILMRKKLKK